MSTTGSAAPAEGPDNDTGTSTHGHEQERYLPIANISRCMKGALPESSKVSREAKELVQEATSEFISFITSESSDKCMRERRKTICGGRFCARQPVRQTRAPPGACYRTGD
jgi:nuclear transcription Y subunit beta